MLVQPATSRISNTGGSWYRNPAMWNVGFIGTVVMPYGITAGEWLCTTAMTSGRAR